MKMQMKEFGKFVGKVKRKMRIMRTRHKCLKIIRVN